MKTRLLLFALPCLLLGACSNPEKDAATKKIEVAAAMSFKDSLLNAARKNRIQDSIDDAKAHDSIKKADSNGAKK
jgi:hypothetical protein